jgi:ferredoxin
MRQPAGSFQNAIHFFLHQDVPASFLPPFPFPARGGDRMSRKDSSTPDTERFTVTVAPAGWTYTTDGAGSLLQAADRASIVLPSSCRNGTCRTCMCRLRQGRARHSIEWPGLSLEEKREGYILPCVAVAESDVTIEVRHARQRKLADTQA